MPILVGLYDIACHNESYVGYRLDLIIFFPSTDVDREVRGRCRIGATHREISWRATIAWCPHYAVWACHLVCEFMVHLPRVIIFVPGVIGINITHHINIGVAIVLPAEFCVAIHIVTAITTLCRRFIDSERVRLSVREDVQVIFLIPSDGLYRISCAVKATFAHFEIRTHIDFLITLRAGDPIL